MLSAVPYTLKYSRMSCRMKQRTERPGPLQAWYSCGETHRGQRQEGGAGAPGPGLVPEPCPP